MLQCVPTDKPESQLTLLRARVIVLRLAKNNQRLQAIIRALCRHSPLFWMRLFCWTFDPRQAQSMRPFIPYPFQEVLIESMHNHIHTKKSDLLIEKSRDMGVSWLTCLVFQHDWLFGQGANYLLGSRKQSLVDSKGDMASLFEKIRFNLRYQPAWLQPLGFDPVRHDCQGRLINPSNQSTLTGEASTAQFARGGRYRAVLLDEFAFWENGDEAWAAAGQSSPCRVAISTPFGKQNAFARLRFSNKVKVYSAHWSQHPHRNAAWYDQQCGRMSQDEIARELDINYNLSLQNRLFPYFNASHLAELSILPNKRLTRVWDFGFHTPACLWMQTDDEGRLLVLREEVGHCEGLESFARRIIEITNQAFNGHLLLDDWCDPAGKQRTDKTELTSLSILNGLGIYPSMANNNRQDGLNRIRHLLETKRNDTPALLVDKRFCPLTQEALSGAYRSRPNQPDEPIEEHPFEDVMDCLRYGAMARAEVWSPQERLAQRRHHQSRLYIVPNNPMTGY
jgi:hypothetical protein